MHFGIVMVLNLTIAGVTPPVGTLMYTTCSITGVRVAAITRAGLPLLATLVTALLAVTLVPELSLTLPGLVFGG